MCFRARVRDRSRKPSLFFDLFNLQASQKNHQSQDAPNKNAFLFHPNDSYGHTDRSVLLWHDRVRLLPLVRHGYHARLGLAGRCRLSASLPSH